MKDSSTWKIEVENEGKTSCEEGDVNGCVFCTNEIIHFDHASCKHLQEEKMNNPINLLESL